MELCAYWRENLLLWARSALVRAVKTAAQTAAGVLGGSVYMGEVGWGLVASASALAALASLLTSVAGIPEVDDGSSVASLVRKEE